MSTKDNTSQHKIHTNLCSQKNLTADWYAVELT